MPTVNINSPRYTRLFAQLQTTGFNVVNNTTGTWTNTGAAMIRADEGAFTGSRSEPYTRLPYLTGTRSEQPGVRGRKSASLSIRGLAVIPSGTAGTAPDMDPILQNIFGAPSSGSGVNLYQFTDTGYLPLSLFSFQHGIPTLTAFYAWGAYVRSATFHFNQAFQSVDLAMDAGFFMDNQGFANADAIAKAGLTAFPAEPASPTVNGSPIAGFGTGYTATITTTATGFTGPQSLELKLRSFSVTIDTGFELVGGVYGSAYPIEVVGGTRRISCQFSCVDDDSAALNAIKAQCDQDNITMTVAIVAGTVAGSIMTMTLNNVQANAFNLADSGNMVDMSMGQSYAHATAIGSTNDATLQFS